MTRKRKYRLWTILLLAAPFYVVGTTKNLQADPLIRQIGSVAHQNLPLDDQIEQARVAPSYAAAKKLAALQTENLVSPGQSLHYVFSLAAQLDTPGRHLAIARLEALIQEELPTPFLALSLQSAQALACSALAARGEKRELQFLISKALSSSPLRSQCAVQALRSHGFRLHQQTLKRRRAQSVALSPQVAEDLAERLKNTQRKSPNISWNELIARVQTTQNSMESLELFKELALGQSQIVPPLDKQKWLEVFRERETTESLFLLLALGQQNWLEGRLKKKFLDSAQLSDELKNKLQQYFKLKAVPLPLSTVRATSSTPLQATFVWSAARSYRTLDTKRLAKNSFPAVSDLKIWLGDPRPQISLAASFGLIESHAKDTHLLLLKQYLHSLSETQRCSLLKAWQRYPHVAPRQLQQLQSIDPAWTEARRPSEAIAQMAWFSHKEGPERQDSVIVRACQAPRLANQLLDTIHVALPLPPD